MEDISNYKNQILISKTAHNSLAVFKELNPLDYVKFMKWFHLRPCAKNITIVTTHPDRPMRGISIRKTLIRDAVEFLSHCITNDGKNIEWDKIAEKYNSGKGFEAGIGNKEFTYQAKMINCLHHNEKLKVLLGVDNLYFTASEVILSRNEDTKKRIDIVAHDGEGKVFFFEMKSPDNEKDNPTLQVKEYLKLYGKSGEKNCVFEKMMKNYPQNPISVINEYLGYGIIGYGDSPILKKEMLIEC